MRRRRIRGRQEKRERAVGAFGRLRPFADDSRGTTAIEFGMISAALVTFIVGIVEFSLVMLAQNSLEAATNISSRLGKTGFTEGGLTREQTIIAELENRAGSIIDTDQVEIVSKAYDQFDQIGKPEPWNDANGDGVVDEGEYTDINLNGQYDEDMGAAGPGDSDDVVVYTVSYPWRLFTPLIGSLFGENGIVTLTARSVVKNEPF